jgi:hypothetical protein
MADETIAQIICDELFLESLHADPELLHYLGAGAWLVVTAVPRIHPGHCILHPPAHSACGAVPPDVAPASVP